MREESIGNGNLEGEFEGEEVWKGLWAWGEGNVWKQKDWKRNLQGMGLCKEWVLGHVGLGGPAGVGPAGVGSEGKSRERL